MLLHPHQHAAIAARGSGQPDLYEAIGILQVRREFIAEVDILANFLLVGSSDKLGKAVPFNKRIIVQVVEPPKEPLEVNSSVNRASYRLRAAGLEIAQICELDEKDCS